MPVKALGNITVTYNGTDITAYCNTQEVEAAVNAIDTTNLASSAQESTPGSTEWSASIGGFWAKALDDVFGPDAITPPTTLRNLVVVIGASGSQATYTWTGSTTVGAFVSSYTPGGTDPNGMLTFSGTISVSGAPVRS